MSPVDVRFPTNPWDGRWRSRNSGLFYPTDPPGPVDPPAEPSDWQDAVDSHSWSTVQSWYAANTGIGALGLTEGDLTPGTIQSTADGQVFQGISATRIRISHDNVTVRGCQINTGGTYGYYNNPTYGSYYAGTKVEYCTFIGGEPPIDKGAVLCSSNVAAGIAASFSFCEVKGWSSGFQAHAGIAVEYCWVHDFYPSAVAGAHVSSAVARGSNVRIHRNFLTEGGSPICSIYFDTAPVDNVTITENLLSARLNGSGNNPSYLLFGKVGPYEATATNVTVGGNYLGDTAGVDFQFGRTAGMGAVRWGGYGNVRTSDIDFLTGSTI